MMIDLTLDDIMDDLRAADETLRRFEQRYGLGTDEFYSLYSQGLLDDGENLEDFAEWSGFYQTKQHREQLLREHSRERVEILRQDTHDVFVKLEPQELDKPQGEQVTDIRATMEKLDKLGAEAARALQSQLEVAITARRAAETALKNAETALKNAEAIASSETVLVRQRTRYANAGSGIAKAYTYEELLSIYRALDPDRLARELEEMKAAILAHPVQEPGRQAD